MEEASQAAPPGESLQQIPHRRESLEVETEPGAFEGNEDALGSLKYLVSLLRSGICTLPLKAGMCVTGEF